MARNRKRTAFFIVAVLVVVVALSFSLLIDRAYIQNLAFEQIERTFGPYITIGNADLSLFPRPRLELTEVAVKEHRDAHAFFRARSLSMEFAIWPLFHQNLEVDTLVIRRPEIEFRRDVSGRWPLLSRDDPGGPLAAGLASVRHLVVDTGHVTIIDESPEEGARGILIDDLQVEWTTKQHERYPIVDVMLTGKIRSRDHPSPISLVGRLEAKPLDAVLAESTTEPMFSRLFFGGRVEAQDLVIGQLLEWFSLRNDFQHDFGRADIQAAVKVVPRASGYDVSFFDMTFHNPLVSFTGAVHVGGFQTEEMTVSIVGNTTPVSLKEIKRFIPLAWIPDAVRPDWKSIDVDGTVEIIHMTIIGPTRSALGISVNGEIRVNDVAFHSATGLRASVEHVTGKILLEPDRIRFLDFTGMYDALPIEAARALILLKDSGPWLEMDLRGIVPGQRVLAAFQEVLGASDSAHPISSWEVTQGEGQLSLRFEGYLRATAQPFAHVILKEGAYVARHLRISLPTQGIVLSDVTGRLWFSPDETIFDAVDGWLGQNPFHLDGKILTQATPSFDNMVLQVKLGARHLAEVGAPQWVNRYLTKGEIDSRLTFSGPVSAPVIKGEVDFVRAALNISPILDKAEGVPGSVEFELRVGPQGEMVFERVELLVLPVRVSGRGILRLSPVPVFQAKINTGSIYVGLLPDGLTLADGVLRSGILEVSLALRGRGNDWRTWHVQGWIALTEGVMVTEGIDSPLSHLFLRIKLDPRVVELKRFDFHVGESDVRLRGMVKNWTTRPHIAVVIESERFDLDRLIPKGEQSPLRDAVEVLADETTVTAHVTIAHPWYKRIRFRDLSCTVMMHDGLIKIDRLEAKTDENGQLGGRILAHLPRGKPGAMRVSFTVHDFPFVRVFESFGWSRQRLVTGTLTMKGMIQGHGRHPQGVWKTLQGKARVTLAEGHVRRGTILPRILAILNLPTLLQEEVDWEQGFPFREARATLSIEEGVLTSQDIVIDSPIMKMTAVGSYDLAQDRLDGVAAVSPFGPYSDFMKSIPLFGKILVGERKGIATALFKIEGPLDDPVVTYLPLESFATGLTGLVQLAFDILKNTVMLPTEILSGDDGKPSNQEPNRESAP